MNAPVQEALLHLMELVLYVCGVVAGSLLLVVALDVPWQLWEFYKKLRMTKEEVKQEMKETDGDPHVKARIRQQQRAMARRRMMTEVPKADVVVTNPTHFAVALRYEEGGMGAPRVVAKGTEEVAARIRALAAEHRVPIAFRAAAGARAAPARGAGPGNSGGAVLPPWPRSWPGSIN